MRILLTVLGLLSLAALPASSQAARRDSGAQDSLVNAAEEAGRAAADDKNVGGYFLVGALGGLGVGLAGIVGWSGDADRVPRMVSGGGALLVVGTILYAGSPYPDVPPHVEGRPQASDSLYRDAFDHAYNGRLAKRKQRWTLLGGLFGAVGGLSVLFSLLPET